jgi:hypothetical protein
MAFTHRMEAGLSPGFFSVRFVRLLAPFSGLPKLGLPRRQSS